jgi:hypothetical protein
MQGMVLLVEAGGCLGTEPEPWGVEVGEEVVFYPDKRIPEFLVNVLILFSKPDNMNR